MREKSKEKAAKSKKNIYNPIYLLVVLRGKEGGDVLLPSWRLTETTRQTLKSISVVSDDCCPAGERVTQVTCQAVERTLSVNHLSVINSW